MKDLDRRTQYTKSSIQNALIQLMKNHGLPDITVKGLCETAEVSRSTFYMYYRNTTEVLDELEHNLMDRIISFLKRRDQLIHSDDFETDIYELNDHFFNYIKANIHIIEAIFYSEESRKFEQDLLFVARKVNHYSHTNKTDYQLVYIISGTIAVIKAWIKDGLQMSTEQLSKELSTMFKK